MCHVVPKQCATRINAGNVDEHFRRELQEVQGLAVSPQGNLVGGTAVEILPGGPGQYPFGGDFVVVQTDGWKGGVRMVALRRSIGFFRRGAPCGEWRTRA